MEYPNKVEQKGEAISEAKDRKYVPTQKHDPKAGFGSPNPIKTQEEGQRLLDTGIEDGKQVYNITEKGAVVKFQPDNTPEHGYHAYQVSSARDIPPNVLREMRDVGLITEAEYNRLRKGKK